MTGLANPVGGKFIKSRRAKSSYTTRRHSEDFLNSTPATWLTYLVRLLTI